MKRISVAGWVPEKEKENKTLQLCLLVPRAIRKDMKHVLMPKRSDVEGPAKRVKVTCVIDVETLTTQGKEVSHE